LLLPGFNLLNLEDFVVILMVDFHPFCVFELTIAADIDTILLEWKLIVGRAFLEFCNVGWLIYRELWTHQWPGVGDFI